MTIRVPHIGVVGEARHGRVTYDGDAVGLGIGGTVVGDSAAADEDEDAIGVSAAVNGDAVVVIVVVAVVSGLVTVADLVEADKPGIAIEHDEHEG